MAGPVVWNSIPAPVHEADTVSSFKRKLKTRFFLCGLTMFDFDFCNAVPVRARVGSGTITAIYYYYYYHYKKEVCVLVVVSVVEMMCSSDVCLSVVVVSGYA